MFGEKGAAFDENTLPQSNSWQGTGENITVWGCVTATAVHKLERGIDPIKYQQILDVDVLQKVKEKEQRSDEKNKLKLSERPSQSSLKACGQIFNTLYR